MSYDRLNTIPSFIDSSYKRVHIRIDESCGKRATNPCRHCFVPRPYYSTGDTVMDLSLAAEIIQNLKEQDIDVQLRASEIIDPSNPLLYLQLALYEKTKQGWISTNGEHLTLEMAHRIKDTGLEGVAITASALLEGNPLNTTSLDIVQTAVTNAHRAGLVVYLTFAITNQNYTEAELKNIFRYCIGERVNGYNLDPGVVRAAKLLPLVPTNPFSRSLVLSPEQELDVIETIHEIKEGGMFPKDQLEIVLTGPIGHFPYRRSLSEKDDNGGCPAGTNLYVIGPNLGVYPCNLLMDLEIGRYNPNIGRIIIGEDELNYLENIGDRDEQCLAMVYHRGY